MAEWDDEEQKQDGDNPSEKKEEPTTDNAGRPVGQTIMIGNSPAVVKLINGERVAVGKDPWGGETTLYIDRGTPEGYKYNDRYELKSDPAYWAKYGYTGQPDSATKYGRDFGGGPDKYSARGLPSLGNFSGGGMSVVGGTAQLDPYLQQLQQEYLRLRLKMVEIPQVLAQLQQAAWQRAQGMMDYGQRQAALTGYTRGPRYGVADPWARAWQAAVSRFTMPQEEEG